MINRNNSSDNFVPTILFIVLASIVLLFANNEKKNITYNHYSSIASIVDVKVNTRAIIPESNNLPPCSSFVDTKNIILDFSAVSDYLKNLQISNQLNTQQTKRIQIKPNLKYLHLQSQFHVRNDEELPSFS